MFEAIFIIILIAGLIWLSFRDKSFIPPKTAPSDERTYAAFERAESLFVNRSELAFFQVMHRCLPPGFHLHSKTRLEDIIRVKKGISGQARWQLRGRVKSRHVDYLITDRAGVPKAAIELDGSSHNKDALNADTLKDGLFKAAGVPLMRVRTGTDYERAAARIIAEL
jgi:very-short-patch-repair endonuclease